MTIKTLISSVALAAVTALGATSSWAATQTLRLATAAPPKTIWQMQLDQLAADIKAETEGRVEVQVFYNAQLGAEQAVLPQVMRGRVDMGAFSTASIADQMGDAYLVSMLFFYDSLKSRTCVLEAVRDDYRKLIAPLGIRLMDWTEVGTGQLSGKEAFPTPDSIKGKRIGVAGNPLSNAYWEGLSAQPVMTPSTEAGSNISTGMIDVYPTIPVFYLFSGVSKVAPVLTKIDYVMSPASIVINQKVWDGLSAQDRAGIDRALAKHPAPERSAAFFGFESQIYQMHQKAGGKVVEITPEQRAQWTANIDAYYDKALKAATPAGRAFFDRLKAARSACAK